MEISDLINRIKIDPTGESLVSPGAYVDYVPMKKMSSTMSLATSSGRIKKSKVGRRPEKALYEFLVLDVCYNLLERYSQSNNLKFRSPKPYGISEGFDENSQKPVLDIVMSYLNGYEFQKIKQIPKTIPVKIEGQLQPLPIYSACAFHLGALNKIKELEGLVHSDYDRRHVMFSPIENISIGMIDLENANVLWKEADLVMRESEKLWEEFVSSMDPMPQKEMDALKEWYSVGESTLKIPNQEPQIDNIVKEIRNKYGVDFDMKNPRINGISIN
jgi:hypothetical protein